NEQVQQTFPEIRLTPSPVNIGQSITWSPAFSFTNAQTLNNPAAPLLVPGAGSIPDTITGAFDNRITTTAFGTPVRIGRWNWDNRVSVIDRTSGQRREFVIPDSTVPGGVRRVVYDETFETAVDWQTGINLPQLFSGTWKLQPSVQILNTTTAGPFMLRNQFSGGDFVVQGKRLAFSAGIRPSFFGFFPGFGPLQRIRHTFSPIVDYRYAPGADVPEDYARALDPTGTTLNARTDPQQTLVVGLSQNVEGKLRAPAGDSAGREPPRIRLLSINTSSVSYNFEQAKQPGRVGWQTQTLTNTFASDLLRGFNLQLTHDLWNGPVGLDTTDFDPFLTTVSANFAITPATLQGIGAVFGLRREPPRAPPGPPIGADTGRVGPTIQPSIRSRYPGAGLYGAGMGQGFSLTIGYSQSRQRGQAASAAGGQRQLQANLTFSPTPKWQAAWNTNYDFDTGRFAQHVLRFERDLHRWRASFSFVKSATGNFAFNFGIALIDQAGIKFDYDQETYR
ncbi:MAG: putative LPS assembly protein LptD, partial [Gemmatimonadales bacterium]